MEILMSLQPYIRQLKPRSEGNINHVDKIQTFLTEGKGGASTYFEGVIAACHNYSGLKESDFKQKILTESWRRGFWSLWASANLEM